MAKFRKKPVVIEAVLFTAESLDEAVAFCGGRYEYEREHGEVIYIDTFEGTMRADRGDWIIKGVKSEFYPCKPDVFAKTYDLHRDRANVNPTIEHNFSYHAPKEGQPAKYEALWAKAKELAYLIDELCPYSREKSLAMTKLEEAVMWANASIARSPEKEPSPAGNPPGPPDPPRVPFHRVG